MVKIENECCGCATENYPCLGSQCVNRHIPHYYCDKCEEEFSADELYFYEGKNEDKELCEDCYTETIMADAKTVEQKIKEGAYDDIFGDGEEDLICERELWSC